MRISTLHFSPRAFARPDLAALSAILLLLAFLALPLAAHNRFVSPAIVCMANMRYLTVAWKLYASDNGGRLVENYQGADADQGSIIRQSRGSAAPWACGWENWRSSSDNTNTLFIRDPKFARLSPYLTARSNVHKCPADIYLSAAQKALGWTERVRSVSLNATLGLPEAKGPFNPTYTLAKKLSDLRFPSPAETAAFLDEHPDSVNDPAYWPPFGDQSWMDFPGNFHDGAATISFADGHVEFHRWVGPMRSAPVTFFSSTSLSSPPQPGDPDIHWMSYHSQRVSEKSY